MFVMIYQLEFTDGDISIDLQKAEDFFAYAGVSLSAFVLIFLAAKEQFELNRLQNYLNHNITTMPLPSTEDTIHILEEKVQALEQKISRDG